VKFWLARMVQGFPNICYLNAFDKILVANPLDLKSNMYMFMVLLWNGYMPCR